MAAFLDSDAFFRVIVGPFGSGKSSGCVMELPRRARQQEPGRDGIRRTRFAVVRNTYRQLEDTTRKTFEQWIPDAYGAWRESDFAFDLRARGIESEILFRALDKPKDVKNLLSLELTGCYFNEVREIPKEIIDAMSGRVYRYPAVKDGGCTWSGIWADTNPWWGGHWGHRTFGKSKEPILGTPRPGARVRYELKHEVLGKVETVWEMYRQPGGLDPDAENLANLDPAYYARLCSGKDQEWIDVYVHGRDAVSDEGAVYGKLLQQLAQLGLLEVEFAHPRDGVFTTWDLGKRDCTSIWFWQLNDRGGVDFIDWYEESGKPLSHYFDVVEKRGYSYVKHWLPHDAAHDTLAAETTILSQCIERWGAGKVAIGAQLSLENGIAAGRWLLEQKTRFHARCADGIDRLREYRYEWDDDKKVWSRTPLHNWASHSADAYRYAAAVVKVSELLKPQRGVEVTQADRQALEWLRTNLSHPNAAKVAEYLESKGLYHAPRLPSLDELLGDGPSSPPSRRI